MYKQNRVISSEEIKFLNSMIGKKLNKVEGYLLFESKKEKTFSNEIRLTFGKNEYLQIINTFAPIIMPDGISEDVGTISLLNQKHEIWLPEGENLFKIVIGKPLQNVAIINDRDEISLKGQKLEELSFTQALVFDFEDGFIVIDKGLPFEDFLQVRTGKSFEGLLTNCSLSWLDQDNIEDIYHREIIWLNK